MVTASSFHGPVREASRCISHLSVSLKHICACLFQKGWWSSWSCVCTSQQRQSQIVLNCDSVQAELICCLIETLLFLWWGKMNCHWRRRQPEYSRLSKVVSLQTRLFTILYFLPFHNLCSLYFLKPSCRTHILHPLLLSSFLLMSGRGPVVLDMTQRSSPIMPSVKWNEYELPGADGPLSQAAPSLTQLQGTDWAPNSIV